MRTYEMSMNASGSTTSRVAEGPAENGGQGNQKKHRSRNSINLVFLLGNLTQDPVLRRTTSGVAIADFGLAIRDGWLNKNGEQTESVCFLDIIVWDRQAEACAQYLRKGSPVFIEGRLQYDEWQDKATGARRHKIKIRAERVQFLQQAQRQDPEAKPEPDDDADVILEAPRKTRR